MPKYLSHQSAARLLKAIQPALDAWVFDEEGDLSAAEYQAHYYELEMAKAEAEKEIGA